MIVAFFSLAESVLAAPPTVTILPYTGGSVSLIGYELVLTPHSGYYLAELSINGTLIEPAPRIQLSADTNYTVHATFKKIVVEVPWQNPYKDIKENDWFFENVKYMDEHGIMNGTGNSLFSPEQLLSRAMMVTMLFRAEGSPQPVQLSSFDDVTNTWYTNAVSWAYETGIVKGYEDGLFHPEQNITREELAVMLYSYAINRKIDTPATAELSSFIDSSSISDWAVNAVCWAVKQGIISGKGDGILDPLGTATRCEAAAMLHRFIIISL